MKRHGWLVVVVVALCAYLGSLTPGWASPGDVKWQYSATGGGWRTTVVVNKNGDRILGANKVSSSGSYWVIACVDKEGNYKWQKTYSGPDNSAYLTKIALDPNGNLIASGFVITSTKPIWHIKSYKAEDGSLNWEKDIDVGDTSSLGWGIFFFNNDMAVDSHGNIIAVGLCVDSGDILGYAISLDSSGHKNWDAKIGTDTSYALAVAIDSHDNAIIGSRIPDNSGDWHVLSLSPSGGKNWEKTFSGTGSDTIIDVAIGKDDRVIVAGYYNGYGWRVVTLDSNGNQLWDDVKSGSSGNTILPKAVTVDSKNNVITVGQNKGDAYVVSYSPSGGVNWESTYNGPGDGSDLIWSVAVDKNDRIYVAGYQYTDNTTNFNDWFVRCYSSSGSVQWTKTYDSGVGMRDEATSVAIDPSTGDVVVAGNVQSQGYARMIDYEGYPPTAPTPSGHVLVPSEVRTISPAASTPDPDNGKYLGFGDVATGGNKFKIEAQFPAYLKQSDNSVMNVKIFIAAQMPDDYSRLAYFDSSNNMKFQPPDKLSSWKASVSGEVAKTTIFPEVDVTSALSNIPSGTHYWYTLVVPDTVPDDFSGVDWATTPWEITVNILEVQ